MPTDPALVRHVALFLFGSEERAKLQAELVRLGFSEVDAADRVAQLCASPPPQPPEPAPPPPPKPPYVPEPREKHGPRLVTRHTVAAGGARRWQYRDATIAEKLRALGPTPDPDEVDGILGPDWSNPDPCDACGLDDGSPRIEVGEPEDYESATATLCLPCAAEVGALATAATRYLQTRDAQRTALAAFLRDTTHKTSAELRLVNELRDVAYRMLEELLDPGARAEVTAATQALAKGDEGATERAEVALERHHTNMRRIGGFFGDAL